MPLRGKQPQESPRELWGPSLWVQLEDLNISMCFRECGLTGRIPRPCLSLHTPQGGPDSAHTTVARVLAALSLPLVALRHGWAKARSSAVITY